MLARMRHLFVLVLAACCPPPAAKAPEVVKVVAVPTPADAAVPAVPPGPPIARRDATIDHLFNLEVADPYRWMEGLDNADFKTWLRAQGDYAAAELAKPPGRAKLHARIRELGLDVSAVWGLQIANGRTIYSILPANAQLGKLATRDGGVERILIDPEKLGTAEHHASLNAYTLSPDGTSISYVISMGGGEAGELHVMSVATGKDLADVIERIWGEGAGAWLPDSKGFFYTQNVPQPAGVDPMTGKIVRLHRLGQPAAKDITILGREPDATFKLAPEEWPGAWIVPGTSWVLVSVGGAHADQRIAVAKLSELDLAGTSKTPWRVVSGYADGIDWVYPHGDRLYLETFKDAPNRKLVSVPLAKPDLSKARLEIAEAPDASMAGLVAAKDGIYVVHNVDGRAKVSRWPWQGKLQPIALPMDGWAHDLATDDLRDGVTLQLEDWLHPGRYFAYDPARKQLVATGLASTSGAVSDKVVADEVLVPAEGGAKVPLTILHLANLALDGSHPTIVNGYGAYGSSQTPGFVATRLAWLERGGVIAVAHVRGGGEKGRTWQDGGSREHKMTGIRDVIACSEYLIATKYTSASKLALEGGSAGGILMGRAMTERPDLFAAVHLAAGMVNPLRILAAENGANQKSELGDPETEGGYKSILEMDPYQHVKANTPYPAVLFTVGLNDHRVAPWMTGKMAARLLASTASGKPILVRVESDAGHGIGSTRDQGYAERADVWSFLLAAFGEPDFAAR